MKSAGGDGNNEAADAAPEKVHVEKAERRTGGGSEDGMAPGSGKGVEERGDGRWEVVDSREKKRMFDEVRTVTFSRNSKNIQRRHVCDVR